MALTLPVGLYFYLSETGTHHATLGKRRMRLHVMGARDRQVTKLMIFARTIIKFLPWEFAHTLVYEAISAGQHTPPWLLIGLIIANILPLLYIACIIFRKGHRGPHDLIAGTIVVRASNH